MSREHIKRYTEAYMTIFYIKACISNIRQDIETINTFHMLAPIAAFVEGEFSGDMSLSTLLNKNLFPQLTTINSLGNIDIPNLVVMGFEPLIELDSSLGISAMIALDLWQMCMQCVVCVGLCYVGTFCFV